MTTTTPPRRKLFLVGPGLIGSSLLLKLRAVRADLDLYALTRREDQAAQLRTLGITPVVGSLTDHSLISDWSSRADIIIHAASADDDKGAFAIVDGIRRRGVDSPRVVYIQTSGNDELVNSAREYGVDASVEDKTISDTWSDEAIEQRIAHDAYHRHVDGPLRERLFNNEAERAHNAITSIMMPPLIYGIGSPPFERISIQTPMLTRYMMRGGAFTLPDDHPTAWNAVWVHDLVEAYVVLLEHLEKSQPGDVGSSSTARPSHYVFPAEQQPFKWKHHFDAVVAQLQEAGHECARTVHILTGRQDFEQRIGGSENPYSPCFGSLVYGHTNSYTKPDCLASLGFKHTARGVVDSITRGKELDAVILHGK